MSRDTAGEAGRPRSLHVALAWGSTTPEGARMLCLEPGRLGSTPSSGVDLKLLNTQNLGFSICKMEIVIPTSRLLVKSTGDHVYNLPKLTQ